MIAGSAAAVAGAAMFRVNASAADPSKSATSPKINFSLESKSAIVTGAARGIGRAIAIALAAAGADIMGIDICAAVNPSMVYPPASKDDLDETGRLVQEQKRKFIPVVADVRDLPAMRSAAERAQKEFGKIDIAIGNAGIQIYGPLNEVTDAQWKDVIDVNLTGCANTIRAVTPHMIPRKQGRIILIASGQGRHGFKNGSSWGNIKLRSTPLSPAWSILP